MVKKQKLTPGKNKLAGEASSANLKKQDEMLNNAVSDLLSEPPTEEPDRPVEPTLETIGIPTEVNTASSDQMTISRIEWESTMATLQALKAKLDAKEDQQSQVVTLPYTLPQDPPPVATPTGNLKLGTEKDPLFPEDYEHTLSHDEGTNRWILRTVHVQLPTSKGLKEQEWINEPSEVMVRDCRKRHMEILTMKYYDELKNTI